MRRIAPQAPADPAPPSLLMSRGRTLGFRRRLILITCVATALILGLAAIVAINAASYRQYNESTRHAHQVESQILLTRSVMRSAESALRGYLLTNDTSQLEIFLTQLPRIDIVSQDLVDITADDARQNLRAKALRRELLDRASHMHDLLLRSRHDAPSAVIQLMRAQLADDATHPIAAQATAMQQDVARRLQQLQDQRAHSARVAAWSTVACLASALALMLSAVVLTFREQRNTLASKEELMLAYTQLAQSLVESRGMADRMQRLHMLSETLQNCRDMREALHVLPPSLEDMLPDSSGAVMLTNASHNMVEIVASWGELTIPNESIFAPDDCLALRRGQPYPDPRSSVKIHCAHIHPVDAAAEPTAWICIPLVAQGESLGVLHLQQPGDLSEDLHDLAVTLGEQLGLLLGNLKLQESLRIQSIRDPLTGLFNRRYLEASLRRELLRNTRHGRNLTVLMMDIDHFKQFNDVHGHNAGDELLQQFAAQLSDQIRPEDIACRYGGEEFTVILPETDQEAGRRRAEDIRKRTSELKVRHHGELLGRVSISIGLATQAVHGDNPETLLNAADQALYRAKRAGRNRVQVASGANGDTGSEVMD